MKYNVTLQRKKEGLYHAVQFEIEHPNDEESMNNARTIAVLGSGWNGQKTVKLKCGCVETEVAGMPTSWLTWNRADPPTSELGGPDGIEVIVFDESGKESNFFMSDVQVDRYFHGVKKLINKVDQEADLRLDFGEFHPHQHSH